mmetsp:Transcript_99693/g.266360  ORF Transcript_99693/g.266360 Transcript_99693/m.266360 type:complete len:412 (-) Transcript_99693:367-1602(-)
MKRRLILAVLLVQVQGSNPWSVLEMLSIVDDWESSGMTAKVYAARYYDHLGRELTDTLLSAWQVGIPEADESSAACGGRDQACAAPVDAVGRLLRLAGSELGRSPADVDPYVARLHSEWFDSIDSLREIPDSKWGDMQVPARLVLAVQRVLFHNETTAYRAEAPGVLSDEGSGDPPVNVTTPAPATGPSWQEACGPVAVSHLEVDAVGPNGYTALMTAAQEGHQECVQALLAAGANVDARGPGGDTALMLACLGSRDDRQLGCAGLLLQAGADANLADSGGYTALMFASLSGRAELLDALLEAGADPGAQDAGGYTALIFAAQDGCALCLRALARGGRHLDKRGADGFTALMFAAQAGCGVCVKELLEARADPRQTGHGGNTALAIARQQGHSDVAALLLAAETGHSVPVS